MRGRQDDAGALHLGGGEHFARGARRIVDGGDAEREVGQARPVLLRDQIVDAIGAVGVAVDKAGHDGACRRASTWRAPAGIGDGGARADRADAVAVDDDDAVLDDAAIARPPW